MTHSRRVAAHTLFALLIALLGARRIHAAPVEGPEINPFACQGQAEVAEADRSIGQMRDELAKKVDPLFLPSDPPTVRAIKLCVVAELKKRVGDADAIEFYKAAIAENPGEPGFEMFAGRYYGGARGARGAVAPLAERHYYRALQKLDDLRSSGRYRDYHHVVEEYVQKGLLVLYQQDGMPLLPWRAYPEHASGYLLPALSVATQDTISMDARDGPGANEVGGFTAEAGLFVLRHSSARQPAQQDLFDIVRQPLRIRSENQLRLRQTYVGTLDFVYNLVKAKDAAITHFDVPQIRNDVDVRELGLAYERSIPLYPLFDLSIRAAYRQVHRVGVVEFLPNCAQDFPLYEVRPTLSRFLSSDKLQVSGTYVLMKIRDIDVDCPGSAPPGLYTNKRGRRIAAANFEYAFYSPLLLPQLSLGSLRPYRTPTRGLYIYGGYVNDNEVFGDHRTINETFYGGARLEGPGVFDIGLTEALYMGSGTLSNPITHEEDDYPNLAARSLRTSLVIAARLLNPDATPGIPGSWGPFAAHSLNWVFPMSFDKVISGSRTAAGTSVDATDFENFRIGTQFWFQMFGTGFGGPAFLVTASYDYQFFYRIPKHMHNVGLTFRMGWRDL